MSDSVRGYQVRQAQSLSTNKVIKNSYILLSMTLLFSSLTAYMSFINNVNQISMFSLFIYIILFSLAKKYKNSTFGIWCVFALTGYMGYTLGPTLNYTIHAFNNGSEIVAFSFASTAIIFLLLSLYALKSQKNFEFLNSFLVIGLSITFITGIISIFTNIPILILVTSAIFVLLSSGYILYETSRVIHGGERNYVLVTITLYVQIFNIFVSLLHLFGLFFGKRD